MWYVPIVLRFSTQKIVLIMRFQEYDTTFEQIERLRELMIAFLKSERRDFLAIFDVLVVGTLT